MSGRPDGRHLREDVEALAALGRDSAGAGERAAAAWVAGRLRDGGVQEVRAQPLRGERTYGWAHATHAAAGLVAARAGGRAGALLALATLASLELDGSGRAPWLRRLLPGAEGANVIGRIPSTGETAAPGDPLAALRRDALMGGLEAPVDASARDLRRVEPVRARQARSRPGSGRPPGTGFSAPRVRRFRRLRPTATTRRSIDYRPCNEGRYMNQQQPPS